MTVTKKLLKDACKDNPWLQDFRYPEYDYSWHAPTQYTDLKKLYEFFKQGNWAVREAVQYKDIVFIQQVNGGDEWLTIKVSSERLFTFESISFEAVIKSHGFRGFERTLNDLHCATLIQCKSLCYKGAGRKPDNKLEWPYPEIGKRWKAFDYSWFAVDEDTYWNQLEAVPPIRMKYGVFMVGEAWSSGPGGEIYTVFVEHNEKYYCKMDYLKNFSPNEYHSQLLRQT